MSGRYFSKNQGVVQHLALNTYHYLHFLLLSQLLFPLVQVGDGRQDGVAGTTARG